ncbi:MAG: hypothetical protein AAFO70_07650 [Pseudomonadota bacterium]
MAEKQPDPSDPQNSQEAAVYLKDMAQRLKRLRELSRSAAKAA